MKHLLKLFLVVLAATVSLAGYAANKDEITLTVTSDGATKDEAIKNALRTAVEQTYGVFVSANTDIFNDDLIKDEIATVSSGNIKKFTEVAHTKNDNSHTITLDVIVSKGKLLSYAKSKGAECELDGAALGQDIELKMLYETNEEKAINNLIREFESNWKKCFDYNIEIDNSSIKREDTDVVIPFVVRANLNDFGLNAIKELYENMGIIALREKRFSKGTVSYHINVDDGYLVSFPFNPIKVTNTLDYFVFRSEQTVKRLNRLFDKVLPQIIRDYSIWFGADKKISPPSKPSYEPYIRGYNHQRTEVYSPYISPRTLSDKETAIQKGQEFYYYMGEAKIPLTEIKTIKNVKVTPNAGLPEIYEGKIMKY